MEASSHFYEDYSMYISCLLNYIDIKNALLPK